MACSNPHTVSSSGTKNQIDKNRLVNALQLCKNRSYNIDFAWGNEISGIEPLMKSLHVEGIGSVPIPIAKKTVEKLKTLAVQAPYGKGLNTVLDTSMRNAWQIDAAKVTVPSTVANDYFSSSIIPALVKLAMTQLGLTINAAPAMEAHLFKMLLYEPGGHFKKHYRYTEKETGMLGTMVLQIPVRGGHQGGSLVVEHNGKVKKFPFDVQSEKKFFLAAFYADCERELEPITKGWRVTLVFDLVWKHQMPAVEVPITLPVLLEVLKEIKESLRSWTPNDDCVVELPPISAANDEIAIVINDASSSSSSVLKHSADSELNRRLPSTAFKDYFESYLDKGAISVSYRPRDAQQSHENFEPDLLFFPLNHKCSNSNVKFSELEGQDYLLALLLQSCPDFDVHLAVIEQHTAKSEYDEEENFDCKRSFEIGRWTNTSNTLIKLHGLNVNLKSQIVGSFSKLLNLVHTPPAKETKVNTSNEGRETNRWYYHAVLVIWPKCQTNRIYLKYNFNGMLSLLEKQVQPTLDAFTHRCSKGDSLEDLKKLLHFCQAEPWIAWKAPTVDGGSRIVRLLKLCVRLEAKAEGLFLLDLLGKEFIQQGVTFYEGIRNHQVAEAIAEFECRVGGWADCAKSIIEIVSSTHILHDMLPYIQFVYLLLDRYCLDGAKDVAANICAQVKSSLSTVATLPHQIIKALVQMLLHLQSDVKTSNEETVRLISSFLPHLTGEQLGLLIINLQSELKPNSDHPLQPYHLTTLEETYQSFLSLGPPVLVTITNHDLFVKILESIILLKNDAYILGIVEKISVALLLKDSWTQTTKFNLLISIITSVAIWGELPNSSKDLILAASLKVLQDWKSSFLVSNSSSSQHSEEIFNFQEIQVAFQLFIALEKIDANKSKDSGNIVQSVFIPLFEKMSVSYLHRFMMIIYSDETKQTSPSNLKQFPRLVELCKALGVVVVNQLESSVDLSCSINFVVDVFQYLFWIEDSQILFAQKIVDFYPPPQNNPFISLVLVSPEIRKMASADSPQNVAAFMLLLNSKIETLATLTSISLTSFTWQQPQAVFPTCPVIEAFLHSPRDKFSYGNFKAIAEARRFSQVLRDGQKTGNYRIAVGEAGAGRTARCEISKTKEGYQLAVTSANALKEELAELNQLRLTIQQQTGSDLKAETSRKPKNLLKTLTQNTAGDLPPAKRARTTRGSVPVVNLT